MKHLIFTIIFLIIFSISPAISQSAPNGGCYAYDEVNDIWRVIKSTVDGVLIASSSTASASAPNYLTMSSPNGAMAGWYEAGSIWVPIKCDADGNIMISGGGSGTSEFTGLTDTPSAYTGQAGKIPSVNAGETALEFVTNVSGTTVFTGLTDTPSVYTGQAGKVATVNAGETALEFTTVSPVSDVTSVNTQTGEVTLDADDIELDSIAGSTYKTIQDDFNMQSSPGYISGGEFTDNGDGSIAVAAGSGTIRATNSDSADLLFFNWSANTPLTCTDNTTTYVYVAYNGGSPVVQVSTTKPTDINTNILLGKVFREGTDLELFKNGMNNASAIKYIRGRINSGGDVEITSGGIIDETGERYITVSAAILWAGFRKISVSAIDTSTATNYELYYSDGGVGFTEVDGSQINNTNYDDGSGVLATLTNNRYRTDWLYLSNTGKLLIRLGTGNYALLSDASAEGPPTSLPSHITEFSTLIGKAIIQEGATNLTQVNSVINDNISFSGIINHNELSSIDGGTAGEYYHLTSAEHAGNVSVSTPAQGDILYYNGTSWDKLSYGTADQILTTNGVSANPSWEDAPSSLPAGTQGDILYHNGTSWVSLGYGTADQVLTTNGIGANPSWEDASSGGSSMTEIVEFPAGSFDYPNGATYEIAPLDYMDGSVTRVYFHTFDDNDNQYLIASHTLKSGYNSTDGITIDIIGFSETQTTGDVKFTIKHSKFSSTTAVDAGFDASITSKYSTVPGTAKYQDTISTSLGTTATYSAGDTIQILFYRDASDTSLDTLSGDWNLVSFNIKYTRDL